MPRPTLQPRFDQDLPVLQRRAEIAAMVAAHQVSILCGATGSGKTTQLPQIMLTLGRGKTKTIAHTQPRRIAARAVAARIAEELGTPLGARGGVGYRVRFDDQSGPDNAVCVLTDGSLLAETQSDRDLRAYDTIIVDEAHERSLNIDFLLGYLKQLLPRRPDLKVVITSATIDPKRFSDHFGGPTVAPVLEVSGRTYPVEMRYRPPRPDDDDDYDKVENDAIVDAVSELCRPNLPPGGILVFLPGEREIRAAMEALRRDGPTNADILPLFSRLSAAEQQRIFHPPTGPNAGRRIILATNVAETSLTVPGIRYVVDTGLARISRYKHDSKIQTLPVDRVSQASADQRSGRCGRVAEGVCIRLYSEQDFKARPRFTEPEVLRTNLASVILQAMALTLGAVEDFPFVEPPSREMIRDGYETLYELSAIDAPGPHGVITQIGRDLEKLPLDPRVGRMLLAARSERCVAEVLVLAAGLSIQDPRERPMNAAGRADDAHGRFRNETSDFLTLLNIWYAVQDALDAGGIGALRTLCRDGFLSFNRVREWIDTHNQLQSMAGEMGMKPGERAASADAIHRALLTGLITNVCCKDDNTGHEYHGPRDSRVSIFPGSVLFKKNPRWFVASEIVETTRLYARTLAKIEPGWIAELAPHAVKRSHADPHWDAETSQAWTWERLTVNNVVIAARKRVPLAPVDARGARRLLIEKGLVEGLLKIDAAFAMHNQSVMAEAEAVGAKLRRHDVLASGAELARFFEDRLPEEVIDGRSLSAWLTNTSGSSSRALFMKIADVLSAEAAGRATAEQFPDALDIGDRGCPLTYRFAPGHDDDGVTLTLPLDAFAEFDTHRADWIVPGVLAEKIGQLLKTLPKQYRQPLEAAGGGAGAAALAALAAECAGVMSPGTQPFTEALSEAVEVLRSVSVPPAIWAMNAVPDHLLLRIVVTDDHGKPVGESRDAAELKTRLAGRIERVLAAKARAAFAEQGSGRDGMTAWEFGELPSPGEPAAASSAAPAGGGYPALIDQQTSVKLTLLPTADLAARATFAGVRRLFAISIRDELVHRLEALPQMPEMQKQFKQLGSNEELRDTLIDLITEKTFLFGQQLPRTREAFDALASAQWGRVGQQTIEITTLVSRILEHRAKITHRLGGGTPRTWAVNIADIREHAAYLMPVGFLRLAGLERLREYPRYVEGLRHRLFVNLREDGSTSETKALTDVAPHWKRLTGWIAAKQSAELAAKRAADLPPEESKAAPTKPGQPIPTSRRAAPTVNFDAGLWAMQPGNLPPEVVTYRWMLEEFRLALFAPQLCAGRAVTAAQLDEAWAKVAVGSKR